MTYPTPPADFDGVTVGLQLIEQAVERIDHASEEKAERAAALQEAARLLKEAWMAVQTAAGRASTEVYPPIVPGGASRPPDGPTAPADSLWGEG